MKAKEKDLKQDIHCHSNGEPPNQCSNWGSNNIDMGSTTNGPMVTPSLLRGSSVISSTVKCLHPSSCVYPQGNDHEKTYGRAVTAVKAQVKGGQPTLQLQDHHYHHDRRVPLDHKDLSLKLLAAPVPHCGSSNALGGLVEGNAGNYSVNGSASGSNHGSNGMNGSSVAANDGGMNVESDNGSAERSSSANASGSQSGSGNVTADNRVDRNKFAQREAALRKFRQKRSERCFNKKVTQSLDWISFMMQSYLWLIIIWALDLMFIPILHVSVRFYIFMIQQSLKYRTACPFRSTFAGPVPEQEETGGATAPCQGAVCEEIDR